MYWSIYPEVPRDGLGTQCQARTIKVFRVIRAAVRTDVTIIEMKICTPVGNWKEKNVSVILRFFFTILRGVYVGVLYISVDLCAHHAYSIKMDDLV